MPLTRFSHKEAIVCAHAKAKREDKFEASIKNAPSPLRSGAGKSVQAVSGCDRSEAPIQRPNGRERTGRRRNCRNMWPRNIIVKKIRTLDPQTDYIYSSEGVLAGKQDHCWLSALNGFIRYGRRPASQRPMPDNARQEARGGQQRPKTVISFIGAEMVAS